jgi:hypothetical protein
MNIIKKISLVAIIVFVSIIISFKMHRDNTSGVDTTYNKSAVLSGFYNKIDKKIIFDDREAKYYKCDVFVVAPLNESDGEVYRFLKDLADSGNTVNTLDDRGNLLVNIDISVLQKKTIDKILSSTSTAPISILAEVKELEGRDALPCESFINISDAI